MILLSVSGATSFRVCLLFFSSSVPSRSGALRNALLAWIEPSLRPTGSDAECFSSWLTPGLASALEAYFRPSSAAGVSSSKASLMPGLSSSNPVQDEGSSGESTVF
jgi:hypothetical protein